jgi:hypothetical protein
MNTLDRINSRGWANGWHALELEYRAKRAARTMATLFRESLAGSSAFNVPAKCINVNSKLITYQFLDGSIDRYPNERH